MFLARIEGNHYYTKPDNLLFKYHQFYISKNKTQFFQLESNVFLCFREITRPFDQLKAVFRYAGPSRPSLKMWEHLLNGRLHVSFRCAFRCPTNGLTQRHATLVGMPRRRTVCRTWKRHPKRTVWSTNKDAPFEAEKQPSFSVVTLNRGMLIFSLFCRENVTVAVLLYFVQRYRSRVPHNVHEM
jgi:hypothetical protein